MSMKNNAKILLFYGVLIAVILLVSAFILSEPIEEPLTYSDIVEAFKNEQVESFNISTDNTLSILTKDGRSLVFTLRDYSQFMDSYGELIDSQLESGIISSYDIEQPVSMPWWFMFIPYVIVAILIIFFWIFLMGQANGVAAARSTLSANPEHVSSPTTRIVSPLTTWREQTKKRRSLRR